ncbi:MAG: DUF2190 family protein [Desulfobacteraceae bacterium]|nr:DUF2190 family protein [Desulfobacteraceae bacterium]
MALNRIQTGDVLDYTNTTGSVIPSGDPVIVGELVGIALVDLEDQETGSVAVSEVWALAKTSAAINQGVSVYLTSAGNITTSSSGNTYAGKSFAAAAEDVEAVSVLLNA